MAIFNYHKDAFNDGSGRYISGGTPYVGEGGGKPFNKEEDAKFDAAANKFDYNKKGGNGFELVLTELGFGHLEDKITTIDIADGMAMYDGILKIKKENCVDPHPYAFIKVDALEVEGHEISDWYWGLYENADSEEDIWGGAFHGATLEVCGNSIGLEKDEIVDGREVRMWAVENGEVAAIAKVKIYAC